MSEPPCQKIPAVIYATGTSSERIERTDRTVAEPQTTGEREREFTRNRASSSPTGPPPPSPTPFYDYAVRSRDPFLLFLLFWIVSSMFMENEKKIRGREEKIARGEHNA